MMHGHEKSDPEIVAMKPANNAAPAAAEPVERRAGTKGNAGQQSTLRAQDRAGVSQALERIRQAARHNKKERFTALLPHDSPHKYTASLHEAQSPREQRLLVEQSGKRQHQRLQPTLWHRGDQVVDHT